MAKKGLNESLKTGKEVVILSDGTGETAEAFVRAVLAQFASQDPHLTRYTSLEGPTALRRTLEKLGGDKLIVYTFAAPELRKLAWSMTRELGFPSLDLLYPAVDIFAQFLKTSPSEKVGALHSTQARDYFQRIDAIEFTVKHDDGMRLGEIHQADIILVGVSRSSKTPTSIYLAHKGYRVANVPLILNIDPPKELIEAHKVGVPVVCLSIRETDLERIRRTRFQNLGAKSKQSEDQYLALEQIAAELKAAQQLARQHRWPLIDVTDRAIEETASEILLRVEGKAR